MSKVVKGFKAFDKNMQCRGMQYEVGKEYTMEEKPIPCERGYHFCKSVSDCYNYYEMSENTRMCEIEAFGEVATDDEIKFCTNGIRIVAEIENPRETSNSGSSNSGYRNSGDRNSGDSNSGDWNSGDRNSGVFCTDKNPKIKLFDKDSNLTYSDWRNSKARRIMDTCPYSYSDFIDSENMTDEEKNKHPEHETIGGFIKTIVVTTEDKQAWWDKLSEDEKQTIFDLPNFDAEKFKNCTGITVKENDHE